MLIKITRPETAISKLEALPVTEKEQSTSEGLVQFADVKCFEVINLALLTHETGVEYILPNDTLIRKAMKEGRELPGVKYWTEKQPRNYR